MDWWTNIRSTAFFAAAEAEAEAETVDPAAIELAEWAEHRAELGLGSHDTGDWVGLGEDRSGLPDWRQPVEQPEPQLSAMDEYAGGERAAAGIKTASDVFGVSPPRPRTHSSPYSI